MPKVRLKISMIFGGSFHRFGTVLDREEIPLNLRKRKYLANPDEEEAVMIEDEVIEQDPIFEDEFDIEPEELPPTTIPSDSRAKYFKPKPKK